MRELIRSISDGNRTVLLFCHLLHEVEQVCDNVTIIAEGKLVAQGEVAELVRSVRGEQVRVKTTDDVRAREILSAPLTPGFFITVPVIISWWIWATSTPPPVSRIH